ncbi:NADPH-dependent 7-cyano-7-deazaguanine reductase QueF [Paenalcaligenes hominis]|uniref:NADPH-dependent 7-cyano-7-deazaguanine reductase QueF n=1 Tax=Paenalcaligenes hominis TaxID=643674 RepID=UPI003525EC5D
MSSSHSVSDSPLGHEVQYPTRYDPSVLFAIERAPNRSQLTIPENWLGQDIWYAYEISWLNAKGKPIVAIGRFAFPWHSPFLVESKSFKLYLNSFNETHFNELADVEALLVQDLSALTQSDVHVDLYLLEDYQGPRAQTLDGQCIDQLDVDITHYQPTPELLRCNNENGLVTETLVSHLLKSNCPVTGQPDWGTVQISYTGTAIDHAALLRYIVSFRKHTEFHEHCVERMYHDLMQRCQPDQLFVMARYTRRGGLDINPWRSNYITEAPDQRTQRQ